MTPDQFRTARRAKGMTQAKAAAYLGTARNTVSRYERGERPIPPLVAIRMAGPPGDLVEEVSRAQCIDGGYDPNEIMANDGPRWRYYDGIARAAITATLDYVAKLD